MEPAAPAYGEDSDGHGRNSAAAFAGATRVTIPHGTLQSGDACPECDEGKVYRQKEAATLIRIVGQAPLRATIFEMERLRCNACGQVFTAAESETASPDKYDATAVAMIAMLKYGTGVPLEAAGTVGGSVGDKLPTTTQWDLMTAAAQIITSSKIRRLLCLLFLRIG